MFDFYSKISFKVILIGVLSVVFSSVLTYGFTHMNWNTMEVRGTDMITAKIIMLIFSGVSSFFVMLGLVSILKVKKVDLVAKQLIISYPLLFFRREYEISDVSKLYHSNFKIQGDNKQVTYHKGKELSIVLKTGKLIKLSSLEITEFDRFYKLLKARVRKNDNHKVKNQKLSSDVQISIVLTLIFCFLLFLVKF